MTLVVHLVCNQQDRSSGLTQQFSYARILVCHTNSGINNKQNHISFFDGLLGLAADLLVERVTSNHPTAGVDKAELVAQPLGLNLFAVAGHPGLLFDNCNASAKNPVHQGGLANIGSSHNGNKW